MEAFEKLFDPVTVLDSYFIDVSYATTYPNVNELKKHDPNLYGEWQKICKVKYGIHEKLSNETDYYNGINNAYQDKGVFYHEFIKITSIVVSNIDIKDKKFNRYFKKFNITDEFKLLSEFRNYMLNISSDALNSRPIKFPTLIGFNIMNSHIPIIIKRIWKYRNEFNDEHQPLPYIFKNYLKSKPWDAKVIDFNHIWKFNGLNSNLLPLISLYSDLKSVDEIVEPIELSKYYWDDSIDIKDKMNYIVRQSQNNVNLLMQLAVEMRKF